MKHFYTFETFKPKNLKERHVKKKQIDEEYRKKIQDFFNDPNSVKNEFKIEDIDSQDLEDMDEIYNSDLSRSVGFREMLAEDPRKTLEMLLKAHILKDKIKYGEFFDWKESEKMDSYLAKKLKNPYEYAYDAYPGGDGYYVVLSTVKLPKAEEIE